MAWLVEQAGSVALERAVGSLTAALGWPNPYGAESGPIADAKLLDELKEQLNCIEGRLDEDRLASLMAAFVQLETARDSRARDQLLADALGRFGEITGLSADGATAEVPNRLLHCWAYLGIASSHALLDDPRERVAKALVDAAIADRHTALPFVGREVIARLLADENFEVTDTFYAPIGSVAPTGAYMPGWARSTTTLASVAMLDLEVGTDAWRFTFDRRPYTDQGAGASRRWEPSAAFDGDGVRVAITTSNERLERVIEIRDAASGSVLGSQEVNGLMVVQSIAEGYLVSGHDDGTVWRWSWSDAGLIERPEALCAVGGPIESSIAVSWDGASLAVRDANTPGTILVLRTVAAGLRARLISNVGLRWTPMAFAGRYFFWTVPRMPLQVVDMEPAAPVDKSVGELRPAQELRSAGHVVRDLAVSPTERLLIALNSSGQASAWPVGNSRAPSDADRRPAPFALPGRTQYLLFSPAGPAVAFSQSDENKHGRGVYVRRVPAEEALNRGVRNVVDETR